METLSVAKKKMLNMLSNINKLSLLGKFKIYIHCWQYVCLAWHAG